MNDPEPDRPSGDAIRATDGEASQAIDSAAMTTSELRRKVSVLCVQGEFDQRVYDQLQEPLREVEELLHKAIVATLDLERRSKANE